MKPSHHVPWLALLGLASCVADLEVPERARIGCGEGEPCPDGLVCNLAGLCVGARDIDTTPPDLAEVPDVTPALGRGGTSFAVSFAVNEALAEPPLVTLRLDAPVDLPCTEAEPLHHECAYTATGTENGGLGGVVDIDVQLVDLSGNTTVRRRAAAVSLDFAAPEVVPGSVSLALIPPDGWPLRAPLAVTGGVRVTLGFSVNEPLAAPPAVTAHSGATTLEFQVEATTAASSAAWLDLPAGVELAQGAYAIEASLTDRAGNTATPAVEPPGGPLVVDTGLP